MMVWYINQNQIIIFFVWKREKLDVFWQFCQGRFEKNRASLFHQKYKNATFLYQKKNIPLQIELETETETIKNILLIKHTLLN